jgi:hypothetical protein
LLAEGPFRQDLDRPALARILHILHDVSFRQLCIIAVTAQPDRAQIPQGMSFRISSDPDKLALNVSESGLLLIEDELRELDSMGLIDIASSISRSIPSIIQPTELAKLLYRSCGLSSIQDSEIERLNTILEPEYTNADEIDPSQ